MFYANLRDSNKVLETFFKSVKNSCEYIHLDFEFCQKNATNIVV